MLDQIFKLKNLIKNPLPIQRATIMMIAKPWCEENLWPLLDYLFDQDEVAMIHLIDSGKPLHNYLPEQWKMLIKSPEAKQHAWALEILNENDYLKLVPPRIVELAKINPRVLPWLRQEIEWVKEQVID